MNERRKNHNTFWFILDDHDGKVEDHYYEAERAYKVPKVKKLS